MEQREVHSGDASGHFDCLSGDKAYCGGEAQHFYVHTGPHSYKKSFTPSLSEIRARGQVNCKREGSAANLIGKTYGALARERTGSYRHNERRIDQKQGLLIGGS